MSVTVVYMVVLEELSCPSLHLPGHSASLEYDVSGATVDSSGLQLSLQIFDFCVDKIEFFHVISAV